MHRLGVVFDSSSVTRLFNKFEVQDAAIAVPPAGPLPRTTATAMAMTEAASKRRGTRISRRRRRRRRQSSGGGSGGNGGDEREGLGFAAGAGAEERESSFDAAAVGAMRAMLDARKERGRRRRARVRRAAVSGTAGTGAGLFGGYGERLLATLGLDLAPSYLALRRGPVRKHRSPDSTGPVPSSLPTGSRAVTYAVAGNTVRASFQQKGGGALGALRVCE